ncbi:major facilitator superfamily transporter [Arcobacter venerupis]|uniref:Major facilitator superfamily transporter n=1 Tax=Arcobacter venerupis TaxID=1054033 RepID=A0AAE7B941_9BACT|nr:MFS transporter [Arcobacter venerupis]QKF67728.1 major facilitator superfamily transporter [Arcobacter venerupis]RWS49117.1 MFS transporter [Arcobacter venerupis]
MIKNLFKSRIALLYIMSISMVFSFSAWMSLLNNYVIEVASFNGSQIGILQSLREIPGFLAFTVVLVILFIAQQRLAYISMITLGLGVFLTGFYPSATGLYLTTIIMSIGFHYLETLNQSLSLQWIDKQKAPIILGKLSAAKSFASLIAFIVIFIMMKFYSVEYKYVYAFFGLSTSLVGIIAWIGFEHFKDDVVQEKKLVIKKEYWLFYILTFFAGARRQIFVVFAGFLLVEKFGVDIHNMVILLFVNACLNIYFAPKIGRFIARVGESITLRFEYIGLVIVFISYAFVENIYFAFFLYIVDHLLFSMAIALNTYFQKIADPKDISTANAVSFTINHIAAVFLPFLLGMVWLYSSSLVFIIGAAIGFLSFILSFLVPYKPEQGFETTLKANKS